MKHIPPLPRRQFLGGLGLLAMAGGASGQDMHKLVLGTSSGSMPAATLRIAREMGLFRQHGLDATVTVLDSASVATMALVSGSISFVSNSPTDVIVARSRGQDLVALCSVYRGFAGVLVLAKSVVEKIGVAPTAPVEARLRALNGLTIATPSATSTYTFTPKGAAESVGSKISFTYMAQPAMVAALEKGVIAGFVAGAPFYGISALGGAGVVWLSGPKGDFPYRFTGVNAQTLNTRREFALANPDIVARMKIALADFARAVNERPAEVKAAIARLYPDVDARIIDFLFATELLGYRTQPLTVADMVHEIEYVRASGTELPGLNDMNPAEILLP